MDWLASNWAWIVMIVAFFALHLFAHGHGGHRHSRHAVQRADEASDVHRGHDGQQTDGRQTSDRRGSGC